MERKLKFELVPDGCWHSNLRAVLSASAWNAVRREVYARAGGKCEICGRSGVRLEEDGSLAFKGEKLGDWKLYGENYVAFTFDGVRYLGAAMPAWIEAENRPGITVSARGEDGLPFFLNGADR